MTALYVAAGGGGDAIAAYAIARALHDERAPAVASYSWDRFVLDPAPGPRRAKDFDDLTHHEAECWEVTRQTRLRSGARSTLTIGAGLTDGRWFLLDPHRGAVGVREQLDAIADIIGADELVAVDVGGDILTHCDEPGLRSPLADSLTLAALTGADLPATVVVAGPGLDGELPAALVEERCRSASAAPITLTVDHFPLCAKRWRFIRPKPPPSLQQLSTAFGARSRSATADPSCSSSHRARVRTSYPAGQPRPSTR